MASEPAQNGAAAVSVFAPIAAPVLRSVDLVQVAKFLKERECYELEILSKQADLPHSQGTSIHRQHRSDSPQIPILHGKIRRYRQRRRICV